jgi:hypothetical protein
MNVLRVLCFVSGNVGKVSYILATHCVSVSDQLHISAT